MLSLGSLSDNAVAERPKFSASDHHKTVLACLLQSGKNFLGAAMEQGKAFGPAGCNIGEGQSIEITSLSMGATMGHQIGLEVKPGWCSFQSTKVRTGIWFFKSVLARVVEMPRGCCSCCRSADSK